MNATDVRKKTSEQLDIMLLDLEVELFKLKSQLALGSTEGTAGIKQVKKDIARVKTILHEREIGLSRAVAE